MFDVFYIGEKPGLFVHERAADSIEHAQQQSRTRYCWVVNYLSDYAGWDWLWEPPLWQGHQRHAWPSQWQKDCGTYLVPSTEYTDTNYHDLPVIPVTEVSGCWQDTLDQFDYTWHPDLSEPPYIYQFGTQWQKTGGPEYVVPGATEVKYVDAVRVEKTLVDDYWDNRSFAGFDYTWHPDLSEPPYIYQFGTQWQKTGGPTYTVPGATEVKYVDAVRVEKTLVDDCWNDQSFAGFDYSWHPDSTDTPYIYQFGTQWQKTGGPRYVVPGAAEVKYVDAVRVEKTSVDNCWDDQSFAGFDYSWHPDSTDTPYIYQFGTQWQKTGGPRYTVPGAAEVKYVDAVRVNRVEVDNCWNDQSIVRFDYTWHPASTDEPYIYQFGTQWQKTGGPTYTVPGATEVKYMDAVRVEKTSVDNCWDDRSYTNFDYTWHPASTDEPYIYQFGTQWQKTGGPTYTVPGATEVKYVDAVRFKRLEVDNCWDDRSYDSFDYTWHPDSTDTPYIYQFGTQWQKTGGPTYTVPGATEVKYVDAVRINRVEVDNCWDDRSYDSFDYTWHPDSTDTPYIYQFGTQWQKTGGPTYTVPGATEVKYVDAVRVENTLVDQHWEKIDNVDDTDFDYTWHPDSTDTPYIYQFGTQWQKTGGPRYVVPGATEVKYVDAVRVRKRIVDTNWFVDNPANYAEFDYTWEPDSTDDPYIYQFGTQWQKTGGPRYVVPGATEVKYVPVPRATRVKVDSAWVMPDSGEFENFDYTWHPDSTDTPYIYQFGTQWQKTGGPEYVVPGATEVKYVEQVRIESRRIATRVFLLDHLDGNVARAKYQLEQVFESVQVVRYFDNYLDTLRRISKTAQTVRGFVWICSSVCDYANFDFSWHPEQWQTGMLHVFASEEQKFGDTFFMHPASFVYRSESCQLLDWYDVNYVKDIGLPRWPLPVIQHTYDTHVEAVRTLNWPGPLAVFTVDQLPTAVPAVSLWREKTKTIVPLSLGATSVVVPKTAVAVIKQQLYDYPHIDKTHTHVAHDAPLDIVFISNGEVNAEQHWSWLNQIADTTAVSNSITHVSGINGRVAAYRAAAAASITPWFFAVFAKLEIDAAFDWAWQPDRMQEPKHYIFYAHNPVTGLEYGHQAIIAYNKKMVLENTAAGLDFTLDQAHEVVPVLSGTAHYHHSAWMCWRTAFRECIKLRHSLPDVENEYRLQAWLDNNLVDSNYGEWSRRGAADAVEYYNSVDGQFSELRNSYDWAWLAEYARIKHGLTPDQ